MTTPEAVIPAAPEAPAAPAAPVASVVPTPEAQAAAVAPAVPAAPAPEAPAAPAPAAATPEPSLLDAAAPAAPAEDAKWYYSEGSPAPGEVPDWFKADKYKSMDEQAKAYAELEPRFGAFTGAPKDGTYAINMPEGFTGEFDTEHDLFQELNKWAGENQFSQDAYDGIIGMFARYEASMVPDMSEIKKQLGDDADNRLNSTMQWAKTNLSADDYAAFRNAQTQTNAADVFKVVEAVIAKTRQVAMPKPGEDVVNAMPTGLEEVNQLQLAVDDNGRRKYVEDSEYRKMVEGKRFAYFEANPPK